VPAWIQHSEAIRLKDLLGCLHVERDRFPLTQLATARVGVERIGDVQKVSPMGQQPLDAVVTAAAFLTCRQCEDVVTGGDYAFLLHSQEGRDPRRHAVRIRRVRFDQLSQDVPADRLLGGQRSLRSGVARREEETDRKRENWTHEDYLT